MKIFKKNTPTEMYKKRKGVLDNIQKELTTLLNKMEGNRKEVLERLDNMHRELNSVPD